MSSQWVRDFQNQNQNSLLVKCQTDNTTPGGMGLDRWGLVPSSHKRSKFRHMHAFHKAEKTVQQLLHHDIPECIKIVQKHKTWFVWQKNQNQVQELQHFIVVNILATA